MKKIFYAALVFMFVLAGGWALKGGLDSQLGKTLHLPGWGIPGEYMKIVGSFDFHHYDKNGNLIWQALNVPNNLADEGEEMMLDVFLRNGTAPPEFFLRLYNDTPTETDDLTDLTGEPSTNGYAAQLLSRSSSATHGWPTLALDSGDFQATSVEKTFSATGGSWGPVTYCVLATTSTNSGKLLSYVALSQSRTLQSGETLKVTYKLKQQ